MKRNVRDPAAIAALLLLLVATAGAQASPLQHAPLYLAKSDCERRLDRCLQGCRAGALESGMCVSLCYKERKSCRPDYGARNLNGSAGLNCPDTSPPTFDGTPSLRVIGFALGPRSTLSRSTQITDGLITESK